MIKGEATICVRFLTAEEGGRSGPIKSNVYGCPIMIDGEGVDCRFVLDGVRVFELGKEYEIAVKFLNPENASKKLKSGDEIYLWEGKKIAEGNVKEIFSS